MTTRFLARIWLLALCGILTLPLHSANASPEDGLIAQPAATNGLETLPTLEPVAPGVIDGQIAFMAAALLQRYHYTKQPFDESVSSNFLSRYIEAFDPQHLHFTQADLAEFEHYRTNLGHLTLSPHGVGDTRPAFEIFNRFMERLEQRVAYSDELLKNEKFEFNTGERISINRHESPY